MDKISSVLHMTIAEEKSIDIRKMTHSDMTITKVCPYCFGKVDHYKFIQAKNKDPKKGYIILLIEIMICNDCKNLSYK